MAIQCVTPKFSSLKQYTFIISLFLCVRNMGMTYRCPLLGSLKGCIKMLTQGLQFRLQAQLLTGSLPQALHGFWPHSASMGCQTEAAFPYWLLARVALSSLPCEFLLQGNCLHQNMQSKQAKEKNLPASWKSHFHNLIS